MRTSPNFDAFDIIVIDIANMYGYLFFDKYDDSISFRHRNNGPYYNFSTLEFHKFDDSFCFECCGDDLEETSWSDPGCFDIIHKFFVNVCLL